MTYCVGILTGEGLVMIADTRTNAGLDNVATFRKLHVFRDPGKKLFALATAGNLGFTQSVISILPFFRSRTSCWRRSLRPIVKVIPIIPLPMECSIYVKQLQHGPSVCTDFHMMPMKC